MKQSGIHLGLGFTMEYKKLLLGAASVLALAVAEPSVASTGPTGGAKHSTTSAGSPLLEFLVHTQGNISPESVQSGIASTFPAITESLLSQIPQFMMELRILGLDKDAQEAAELALSDRIDLSDLDEDLKTTAREALSAASQSNGYIQLAQSVRSDGRCDQRLTPAQKLRDPDCAPPVTGATRPDREQAPATTGATGGAYN